MKIFCFVAASFLSFFSNAQKSYYFSKPLPSASAKINAIDAKYFGNYASNDGLVYQVNADGIQIISTTIASMSRESIRESSKYDVRNGYIFGVVVGDSLPCILDGETYFFGVQNSDVFIGSGSENILTKTASPNEFIVNRCENGHYIPIKLSFQGQKLTLSYFDYDLDADFTFIADQKSIPTEYNELILLSPTTVEYQTIGSTFFIAGNTLKRTR